MKRYFVLILAMAFTLSLAACGTAKNTDSGRTEASLPPQTSVPEMEESDVSDEMTVESNTSTLENMGTEGSHILIAYFSVPEDVDTTDAVSGASIVVRDGEKLGNTEYAAKVIQETIGGDLFRIETVQQYPLDHDPLVEQAAEEQDADVRPELAAHVGDIAQYDTVILGFPNWWGDLPQPLYTFLEEYDLSGKTIIPFVTHGGSGFSDTRNTIAGLQPGATVSSNTLSLSRNDVDGSGADVAAWAESLGINE